MSGTYYFLQNINLSKRQGDKVMLHFLFIKNSIRIFYELAFVLEVWTLINEIHNLNKAPFLHFDDKCCQFSGLHEKVSAKKLWLSVKDNSRVLYFENGVV